MATPPLRYSEAAEKLRQYLATHPANAARVQEDLPLASAAGRVLAQPIQADRDQPPFPRSTRDGFACRAADANTHAFLRLAGRIRAGEDPSILGSGTVASGEAWEIMTGAPVPPGADAVFMVENANCAADPHSGQTHSAVYDPETRFVRLQAPRTLAPGENIVPQGSEAAAGARLLSPGIRLGPAHIALAAQCGYAELAVFAWPKVAILSTGDELVSVESTPGPSQIRNSNTPMLAALVASAGGQALPLDSAPDQPARLSAAIRLAFQADLLLVTGGISAGRFDLVDAALLEAGAQFLFRGVAMQPGKPLAFGEIPRQNAPPLPFFALPGNPISSAVTFRLFAAPLLAALAGASDGQPRFALAHLAAEWRGKPGLTRFLPAFCDFGLSPKVKLVPWQGSGDLAAFARSNCLVAIADDLERIAEGAPVPILPL